MLSVRFLLEGWRNGRLSPRVPELLLRPSAVSLELYSIYENQGLLGYRISFNAVLSVMIYMIYILDMMYLI